MRQSQISSRKLRLLLLREWLQNAAPAFPILLLLLLLFAGMLGGSIRQMNLQDNELKDAPLASGTAVIIRKAIIYTKTGMNINWQFRINGQIASNLLLRGLDAASDERLIWTKVGDTVPVTYRVGKSGTIYIENWQAPPHKVSLSR